MNTINALFGQLRSLLHQRSCSNAERGRALAATLHEAVSLDPERASQQIVPYLLGHLEELPTPVATSSAVLMSLATILPEPWRFVLDLRDADLTTEELHASLRLRAINRVQDLFLSGHALDSRAVELIAQKPFLIQNLQNLHLDRCALTNPHAETLFGKEQFPNLERLHLGHNLFDGVTIQRITARHAFPRLTHLDLGHKAKIDAQRSQSILHSVMANDLIELGANQCGLRALSSELAQHERLEALDLSKNYLIDVDLGKYLDSASGQGLRHVDLSHNSVGDQTLLALLRSTHALESLRMANTNITPHGILHLIKHPKHKLTQLDLSERRRHHLYSMPASSTDEVALSSHELLTMLSTADLPALQTLNLTTHPMHVDALGAILSAPNLRNLKSVYLSSVPYWKQRIMCEELMHIVHPYLHERSVLWHGRARDRPAALDLHGQSLSGAQIGKILVSSQQKRFHYLGLGGNRLNDVTSELFECMNCAQLEALSLADAKLTDKALEHALGEHIERSSALKHLLLSHNEALGDHTLHILSEWGVSSQLHTLDLRETSVSAPLMQKMLESGRLRADATLLLSERMVSEPHLRQRITRCANEQGVHVVWSHQESTGDESTRSARSMALP